MTWKLKAVVTFVIGGLIVSATLPTPAAEPAGQALVKIVIRSQADLAHVQSAGVPVFVHLRSHGELVLLAGAEESMITALRSQDLDVALLDRDMTQGLGPGLKSYYLAYPAPGRLHPDWGRYGRLLYDDGTQALLDMTAEDAVRLAEAGAELRAVILEAKPLGSFAAEGAQPTAITPDPAIQAIIDQVDSADVYHYTGDLSGAWPVELGGSPYTIATRYTYSGTPIYKATQYVTAHLQDLGLEVENWYWGGSTYPDVIGEMPGVTSPDSIFIICAHLDDMPSGSYAPGADDNASGCAAVLAAADILTQYEWAYTLRFALWTGEEQGLYGSYYYAQRSYNWGEKIVGVLNLDMIAYNTIGSSPGIDLHANADVPGTMDIANLFADVVSAYGINLISDIHPYGSGSSDHASFWNFGYAAILGIEDFNDFNPYYHSTSDLLAHLDMGYFVKFVRAAVGSFAHMSGGPLPPTEVAGLGGAEEVELASLAAVRLHPASPNPAISQAIIRYDVARPCAVELGVYDVRGALTATLRAGAHEPGHYTVAWNGQNDRGEPCPPGVYFYRVETDRGGSESRKIVLVR